MVIEVKQFKRGGHMNNSIYRRALDSEYKILGQLSYESESYWQYSQAFIDIFKEKYNITAEWIKQYQVRVLEVKGEVIGFWGAKPYGKKLELEYFYIEVGHIGKGYGKLLWKDLLSWCKTQGILEIEFVRSEQVIPFYEKQGAQVIGKVNSEIDGRTIPLLSYKLE